MKKAKIAFLFRYGAGEHVDFLPALPAICARLQAAGCELHHFGFDGGRPPPGPLLKHLQVHLMGPRVNRFSSRDKHLKAAQWLCGLPRLGRRLRQQGFDLVFVDETLPLSAALLRKHYPGKLAFTIHDFFTEIYLSPRWWGRLPGRWIQLRDQRAWRELDLVLTRVTAAREHLIGLGIPAPRIRVVHDSVNLEMFHPRESASTRHRLGFSSDQLVLVHHGIMHPNKGNDLLVKAVDRLRERLPQLRLLLIGEGPEFSRIQRLVRQRNLEDRVQLTGWLPGMPEIAETLAAADLGLVMRRGFPGDDFHVTSTLVHNLACGLPVLAARLAGIAEVVEEGREGLLFAPECGEEFDRKLIRLAEDVELRRTMGRAARVRAEALFAVDRIADQVAAAILDQLP